jgi:hypothetical protein
VRSNNKYKQYRDDKQENEIELKAKNTLSADGLEGEVIRRRLEVTMSESNSTRICPFCREEINEAAIRCKHCHSWTPTEKVGHGGVCPLCKEQIHPEATRCKHCKADLSSNPSVTHTRARRGRRSIAIRRSKDDSSFRARARDPLGWDEMIQECIREGCDPAVISIVDGQVVILSLSACDDDWCYYDFPGGIV